MFKSGIVLCVLLFVSAVHSLYYQFKVYNNVWRQTATLEKDRINDTYNILAEYEAFIEQFEYTTIQLSNKLMNDTHEFYKKIEAVNNVKRKVDFEMVFLGLIARANITECTKSIEELSGKAAALIEEMNACAGNKTTNVESDIHSIVNMTQITVKTLRKMAKNVSQCSKRSIPGLVKLCCYRVVTNASRVVSINSARINVNFEKLKVLLKAIEASLKSCSLDADTKVLNGSSVIFDEAQTCAEKKYKHSVDHTGR